jgi:hypothetical protein
MIHAVERLNVPCNSHNWGTRGAVIWADGNWNIRQRLVLLLSNLHDVLLVLLVNVFFLVKPFFPRVTI